MFIQVIQGRAANPTFGGRGWTAPDRPMVRPRQTIHDLLARAQARYRRLTPAEAFTAMQAGALLIDLRTDTQRRRDGEIPGALVIDRMVLEWRVDPTSGAAHAAIGGLDTPLILLCGQGYSSSLAVGTLLDLGASRVTDVTGGFEAWRAAGLPVQ
jgi:rhodanese-related sulfurtransferase